ncbi:ABC transporter family substrate-binding protein [Natronosporangium hydrolyticum]|uniref:ABC transporter family substrate-binding protein n=1 Tax=Natronosporangium hydrolyticum TaxID=2811111 RepID=A0A895YM35_9ACTN|nr:ABC transporter family substrate-binding protein [Natronosporangium hydrolyticum]QSB15160.1 ABC transporter family substrate-binding protein [Natronosporangium hydrolyticum]
MALREMRETTMRRRWFSLAVAAGAGTALVLAGCAAESSDTDAAPGFEDCVENPNECNTADRADGGTMVWALDQAPDGYFPWSSEGGSVYTLQAIHGILPYFGQFMPDGEYDYNMDVLAAEPELLSEDPFVVEFQLDEAAEWNDGTPISADDVRITWMMSTSEGEGHCEGCRPRATGNFDVIEDVSGSEDGKTVTITYKDGIAVPEWFSFGSAHNIIGGIAPAHVAEQQGWDIDTPSDLGEYFEYLNDNPAEFSGGPYLLESFDIDTQVVKVPNPNWYGEVQPTLDRLVMRFLTDEDTWLPALQNDELHGGSPAGFAEDVVRQVRDMEGVRVHIQPGPSWEHLDLNLDNQWLGEHQELREAIFVAVDAEDIADRNFAAIFPDYQLRTNHVHSEDSEFHVDHLEGTGQGTGDVEMAREILEAAGFEGMDEGPGGLTYDGETVGPFRLRSTSAPARATAQQLIQGYLAEIGIEANIEPTDDLGGTLVAQDYDLMQYGWSGSPLFTGIGSQYWETGSSSNYGNYSNDEVDALIEQEQQAPTLEESAALHDQMMELVVDDAYVLPLYDSPVYVFVSEDYANVRDNTNTSLRAMYEHHYWGEAAQ